MKGWKTWVGALLVGTSGALRYFGYGDMAEAILVVGASLGLIGLGHKIEKAGL